MAETIQNLLSQVNLILKKHEEVAKITGENYNIFKILGLTSNEVKTHSAFIANLLSPNGSHGQNNEFLIDFINSLSDESLKEFDTSKSIVQVEKHIGLINKESFDDGGRIDIVVTDDKNNRIIIENKIYAGDQYKQLKRYYEFDKTAYLIYLTLDGNAPSKESVLDMDAETISRIKCIAYKDFIITWLERCKSIAVNHPLLRETITQYINLIKLLTNQSISKKMSEELQSIILKTKENFIAASNIQVEVNIMFEKLNIDFLAKIIAGLKSEIRNFEKKIGKQDPYLFHFFKFEDYDFYIRISLELGMSVWLTPILRFEDKFAVADDEKIKNMKSIVKFHRGEYNVFQNQNYTGWIICNNDFTKYDVPEKYDLLEKTNSQLLIGKITEEITLFIDCIKSNAKNEYPNIVFNF